MAGEMRRLVDQMRDPPGRRATATWFAFVALLSNLLLSGALSTILDLTEAGNSTPRLLLCGGWRDDAPSKTKPGLLVQHCPWCTMPAAPLPRPPAFAFPGEIADSELMRPLPVVALVPIRHGRMQPRAPPSAV